MLSNNKKKCVEYLFMFCSSRTSEVYHIWLLPKQVWPPLSYVLGEKLESSAVTWIRARKLPKFETDTLEE